MAKVILSEKEIKRKIHLILPENLWNIIENYNEYLLKRLLKEPEYYVNSVCIHPNNKQIISCSNDKIIKIWNLKTGKCEKTLKGHTRTICSVCVSPNGKQIILGIDDNTIKIWDLESGNCEKILKKHERWVSSVYVTPNGKQIISGSADNTIKIWDLKSGEPIRTLRGHTGIIRDICVHPNKRSDFDREGNGKQIISGSDDNTIKIWDLKTGKCEKTLKGHTRSVLSVCVTPNRKQIISGSLDKTIKIWDLETGDCKRTLRDYAEYICSVYVTPNGKQIISRFCKNIRIWNLNSKMKRIIRKNSGKFDIPVQMLKERIYHIESFCVTSNGKQIISLNHDRTIKIWTKQIFKD